MSTATIERPFTKMGARVKVDDIDRGWRREGTPAVSLDVRRDIEGEYFLIRRDAKAPIKLEVLDVQPKDRHLLMLIRDKTPREGKSGNLVPQEIKSRFLMGHDERHWFVAAIPEASPVSTVKGAKHALKPEAVHSVETRTGIKAKHRDRRSNVARRRQGEWFFIPELPPTFNPLMVLRNEPLVRSRGGKPHMCEELYRFGGETVYVDTRNSSRVLTEKQYEDLDKEERQSTNWRMMKMNPQVYVRGRVRHSDHKTIILTGWHKVEGNTETLSYAMRNVMFLD